MSRRSNGRRGHSRWRMRAAVGVAALLTAGATASTAFAYWDVSQYFNQGDDYSEAFFDPTDYVRLSRQYCGTKMYALNGGGWVLQNAPNGCADGDFAYGFNTNTWVGGMCYNSDGPTMFVNCRIDAAI